MDDTTFWIMLAVIGIGTMLMRGSFILSSERFTLSEKFSRILRFIPASILAALVAPSFVYHQGMVESLQGKERLLAGVLALLVAARTKNIFLTIFTGMGSLYCLQFLL